MKLIPLYQFIDDIRKGSIISPSGDDPEEVEYDRKALLAIYQYNKFLQTPLTIEVFLKHYSDNFKKDNEPVLKGFVKKSIPTHKNDVEEWVLQLENITVGFKLGERDWTFHGRTIGDLAHIIQPELRDDFSIHSIVEDSV